MADQTKTDIGPASETFDLSTDLEMPQKQRILHYQKLERQHLSGLMTAEQYSEVLIKDVTTNADVAIKNLKALHKLGYDKYLPHQHRLKSPKIGNGPSGKASYAAMIGGFLLFFLFIGLLFATGPFQVPTADERKAAAMEIIKKEHGCSADFRCVRGAFIRGKRKLWEQKETNVKLLVGLAIFSLLAGAALSFRLREDDGRLSLRAYAKMITKAGGFYGDSQYWREHHASTKEKRVSALAVEPAKKGMGDFAFYSIVVGCLAIFLFASQYDSRPSISKVEIVSDGWLNSDGTKMSTERVAEIKKAQEFRAKHPDRYVLDRRYSGQSSEQLTGVDRGVLNKIMAADRANDVGAICTWVSLYSGPQAAEFRRTTAAGCR